MPYHTMESRLRADLLAVAGAYVAIHKVKFSTLSLRAHGDPPFLDKIAQGGTGSFTVRKYDEMLQWLSDNWPAGAKWPRAIPRPPKASAMADVPPVRKKRGKPQPNED